MFYQTNDNRHGPPHDPFKVCLVPRPIGWIVDARPLWRRQPRAPAPSAIPHIRTPAPGISEGTNTGNHVLDVAQAPEDSFPLPR